MWKVEVWDKTRRRWKSVGGVEGFDKAKQAVCELALKGGVAQATLPDADPDEIRAMRAWPNRGWWCWTGSGGLVG